MDMSDFNAAQSQFNTILSNQPNLFAPQIPNGSTGEKLAEAMIAFIRKYSELKTTETGR